MTRGGNQHHTDTRTFSSLSSVIGRYHQQQLLRRLSAALEWLGFSLNLVARVTLWCFVVQWNFPGSRFLHELSIFIACIGCLLAVESRIYSVNPHAAGQPHHPMTSAHGQSSSSSGNPISPNIAGMQSSQLQGQPTQTSTNIAGTTSAANPSTPTAAYFEVCVNRSRHLVSLGEILLKDTQGNVLVNNDLELFAKIRRRYEELRLKGLYRYLCRQVHSLYL